MEELLQILIGSIVTSWGIFLLWTANKFKARHALTPFEDVVHGIAGALAGTPVADKKPKGPNAFASPGGRDPGETTISASSVKPKLMVEKIKTQPWVDIRDLVVKVNDDGKVILDLWAANIANAIHVRCHGQGGNYKRYMDKNTEYERIQDSRRLLSAGWIQVWVHPALHDRLIGDFADDQSLCDELRETVYQKLRFGLDSRVLVHYQPVFQIFKDASLKETTYMLRLHPSPPESARACDGGIIFFDGRTRYPREANCFFQVANQPLRMDRYAPFRIGRGDTVLIGPSPWCHIQTPPAKFADELTIRLRKSDQIGILGRLEFSGYRGKEILFLEAPGHETLKLDRHDSSVKIPTHQGLTTQCNLRISKSEGILHLATLVLANPRRPVHGLPDVAVFDKLYWSDRKVFARFLTTQVYVSTLKKECNARLRYLDGADGLEFLKNNLKDDGSNILTGEDELRYQIKIVLSSASSGRLREIFKNEILTQAIAVAVTDLIENDDHYSGLFDEGAVEGLKPSDQSPGMTIDIHEDEELPGETVLIRTLPIRVTKDRGEIFGEICFSEWKNAVENSGMSCDPHRNFLIPHPSNTIQMRISRFPLYGIVAPQVRGAIGIILLDPDRPNPRLKVENHCPVSLRVGEEVIPPDGQKTFPAAKGEQHEFVLSMQRQSLKIIIYKNAKNQEDEPAFIHMAGKLSFYGLTLGRKADKTGWKNGPFQALWDSARQREGDIELKGLGLATPNGFLASLIRDATSEEVHYFTAKKAKIQKEGADDRSVEDGESTLLTNPLGATAEIVEDDHQDLPVEYMRVNVTKEMNRIDNADILLADYHDYWFYTIGDQLPDYHISRVELLRCFPENYGDFSRHLYFVLGYKKNGPDRGDGWLFQPKKRIQAVYSTDGSTLDLDCDRVLVGPLDPEADYLVDWDGEKGTYLNFQIKSHLDQVELYLSDGFYSMSKGMPFGQLGKLSGNFDIFTGREDCFISNSEVLLTHVAQSVNHDNKLPYDPRDLSNYFDKDSYSIAYHGATQGFVVRSKLHPARRIEAKTVFLIVQPGERVTLGSHAIPHALIPKNGHTFLVFPGMTLRFSQGQIYYGN